MRRRMWEGWRGVIVGKLFRVGNGVIKRLGLN